MRANYAARGAQRIGHPSPLAASIRVLVCDDHALLRSGLRRLLEAEHDIEVAGEAANADEAIERTGALRPDVVLLDIVMPGRSGVDALPDLLAAAPATKGVSALRENHSGRCWIPRCATLRVQVMMRSGTADETQREERLWSRQFEMP